MVRVTVLAVWMALLAALLSGCGQVMVFGHVMGERRAQTAQPEVIAAQPEAAAPEPAAEAGQPGAGATQPAPTAREPAAAAAQPDASDAPSADARVASAPAPVAHVVKSVNVIVTSEVTSQATGAASRFTADALLDAIKTELKSRKLLDEQNPHASGTAEIVVDELATRPTSNAVLSGYKMLAGTLEGEIRVTGSRDVDSTGSRIVAQSKLTVAASGEDPNPLGPLYRRFAVLAADRLAGVTSPPREASGIPRF